MGKIYVSAEYIRGMLLVLKNNKGAGARQHTLNFHQQNIINFILPLLYFQEHVASEQLFLCNGLLSLLWLCHSGLHKVVGTLQPGPPAKLSTLVSNDFKTKNAPIIKHV